MKPDIVWLKKLDDAWFQGWNDCVAGISSGTNPYNTNELKEEWLNGWCAADSKGYYNTAQKTENSYQKGYNDALKWVLETMYSNDYYDFWPDLQDLIEEKINKGDAK